MFTKSKIKLKKKKKVPCIVFFVFFSPNLLDGDALDASAPAVEENLFYAKCI